MYKACVKNYATFSLPLGILQCDSNAELTGNNPGVTGPMVGRMALNCG